MTEVQEYCSLHAPNLRPAPPCPPDKELNEHDSTYLQVSLGPLKCTASELCLGLHLGSATKAKVSQGLVPTVVSADVSGDLAGVFSP